MIQIDVVMSRLFTEGASDLQVKLELQSGSLTALVGPSGSGKTTVLRLLAGLEIPRQGRIVVGESVWLDTYRRINRSPQQRSIGYVFQDTALFPNMTVRENIQYAAPKDQQTLVDELIEATGLESFVNQKPIRLSGGQRQRVALARALVRRPQLLLLDEPFAALDAKASQMLRQVLLELHQRWGTTTLLVSHHEIDVQALADRVIQLVQGRVESDERIGSTNSYLTGSERIIRIEYDENQQHWLIETASMKLQSTNPDWEQWNVGDLIQVAPGNHSGTAKIK
ncbi:sulfate/molybdate ABC transporter ATP-binding protein [Spirosoma validum]|uniref:ATP-binding cassette domain-containing protein n=1 Tax=Spirosoma validum TaxID=2771355 RepID=A0A927B4D4_9BACT|nr:ATP-binding cassette domain-containing protein [Spirosoma validum]MBD2755174.1 ATP-binding cassette domain-containing protein [Spirosoma validum]